MDITSIFYLITHRPRQYLFQSFTLSQNIISIYSLPSLPSTPYYLGHLITSTPHTHTHNTHSHTRTRTHTLTYAHTYTPSLPLSFPFSPPPTHTLLSLAVLYIIFFYTLFLDPLTSLILSVPSIDFLFRTVTFPGAGPTVSWTTRQSKDWTIHH